MEKKSIKPKDIFVSEEEKTINWNEIQVAFEKTFGTEIYSSWLEKISLVKEYNDYLILSVPTRFFRDWIVSRYLDKILEQVKAFKLSLNRIEFKIIDDVKNNSDLKKIVFQTKKKHFPARIVTGLFGYADKKKIPFECSLGIVHPQRRGKKFQWGSVGCNQENNIYLENYKEYYEIPKDIFLTFAFIFFAFWINPAPKKIIKIVTITHISVNVIVVFQIWLASCYTIKYTCLDEHEPSCCIFNLY